MRYFLGDRGNKRRRLCCPARTTETTLQHSTNQSISKIRTDLGVKEAPTFDDRQRTPLNLLPATAGEPVIDPFNQLC